MPSTKTLRVTLQDIVGGTGGSGSTAVVHARYVTANGQGRDVHLTDGTIVVPVRRSVTPGTGPEVFDFTVIPSDDGDVREADRGFLTEVSWTVTAPEGGKSHGVRRVLVPSTADAIVQLGLLSTPIAMPTVSATVIDGGNASAAGYVIRPRRDTTLGWAATNPVLALGEIGFDTDTGEVRVGNGVNQWSDLPDGMVNAYSIAVANGFVGDEAAWLASLVGPVGPVSTTPGPEGPPGPPNALTPGTATTGAAGTSASFTITGTAPSQVLNLTIPRGPKGDPGDSQLLEPGPNRFNAATVTLEYRVDHTTGALTAAAGWWASDFIPVAASSPYWAKVSWYRAYYDNTKTFISGVNVGATAGATFTTPAGAAYVRDSYFNQAAIATQVIAEGSTALPWEAYRQQVPTALLRKVVPSLVVTDTTTGATLGDALTSLATVAGQPVNRANPATVTDGYWINEATGGTLTAGADWHLTDYIPVTAGAVYTGTQVWRVAWYTVGRAFISGSNLTPQGTKTFTAPALAAYLRISYWGAAIAPSMVTLVAGAEMPPVPYRSASLDTTLLKHAVTVALPPTIPALVGVETNLYFDGIVSSDYALYDIDITCSIGTQQADRWTVVPAAAGTYALTFDLYRDGVGVARATTSVVVKAAAVGTGITKSVVVIGDSLIDNATSPPTVLPTLFGAGDPMDITMLGTRGTGPGLHEGRSGWSTTTYTTLATSGGVTNAFWSGSAFSFPAWKTAQGYATVDYAIINLGINDIFAPTTDAAAATAITTALAQLGTMVTSITGTGTKVGICVTTPPARSQDAFGASYGSGQTRWRYRRNLAAWNAALIATFGGRTAEGIYLLPTNAALDTVNNFPTTTAAVNARNATTSARQNNGVHCSSNGSAQIADVMHHWIKGFES